MTFLLIPYPNTTPACTVAWFFTDSATHNTGLSERSRLKISHSLFWEWYVLLNMCTLIRSKMCQIDVMAMVGKCSTWWQSAAVWHKNAFETEDFKSNFICHMRRIQQVLPYCERLTYKLLTSNAVLRKIRVKKIFTK